jgi:hypothetical protein
MTGEVNSWPDSQSGSRVGIRLRLEGILAIFYAIDAGELLAALPDCETARAQHTTALNLLAMVECELMDLVDEMVS